MDEQLFFAINGAHNIFFDQLMWLLTGKVVWVPLYVSLLYAVWRNYSWRGAVGVYACRPFPRRQAVRTLKSRKLHVKKLQASMA